MRIAEAVEMFFNCCRYEKNLTDKTVSAYATDLEQFIEFIGANFICNDVEEVTKNELRAYVKALYEDYKPKSIKRKLATLKAFFTFLEFEDYIAVNPFRKTRFQVAKGKELPRTMSAETVRRLFTAAYAEKEQQKRESRGAYATAVRDVAVLELLFATGMRVSELCKLRLSDVRLEDRSVLIQGKGRRERVAPLCSSGVLDILEEYLDVREGGWERDAAFLLNRRGNALSDQSVRMMLKALAKKAGVKENITPHMFRHTLATMLLENGVDIRNIQSLLGHSSISVTEIYVEVNGRAQREVLEAKHPREGVYG